MTLRSLSALALLAVAACKGNREASQSKEMAAAAPMMSSAALDQAAVTGKRAIVGNSPSDAGAASSLPSPTPAEQPASMLIRTGAASIEVDKLDPAVAKVRQMATQVGGYVANSSFTGGRDQVRSATLEVKIPSQRYDQAVGGLGNIGKVESVQTNVEDVGEEYVDITARVANAKRLEERLVNLLATRTGKLEDVLAVERELARVREEIERYEGRMRYLRTRAAMSTLTITVHEPQPILGQSGDNPIVGAIKQAWRNFVRFVSWFIASLGVLVPVAVLVGGGWYVFRRYRKA
jgi:hypothetical protein